ncbi:M56 family metallopeptidase [uncultured Algimonas sp.]|uniref:M56 family metallopeptidase n=1 Tax=uncultured Algimonas sp. TaxID=1547920 RepID=UPI0026242CE0|nr:M56 family metallopeptidase [uncultured Algimonas sp.]
MTDLAASDLLDTVTSTAFAVTALLVLVLVSRRTVARRFGPRAAYALWALPVLRLFTPAIVLPAALTAPIRSLLPQASPPAAPPAFDSLPPSDWIAAPPAPGPVETAWLDVLPTVAVWVWLTGIVAGTMLVWMRQCAYRAALMRETQAAPSALQVDIDRAAHLAGLYRAPDVRIGRTGSGPAVSGLLQPVILLPADFEARFTPAQRRFALLHEMAHIRRGDLWAASAMLGFRLLNWPNPLVHWAWPRFRADQEAACDAAVLRLTGEACRADYAETLLVAARQDTTPTQGTALCLSLHHPVKERLMTLRSNPEGRRDTARWALAASLLSGAALCAPLSLADPAPAPQVENVSTVRVITQADGETKHLEIRDENGERVYLRTSPDGTREHLTREQVKAEYGIDVDAVSSSTTADLSALIDGLRARKSVDGEPGLSALQEGEDNEGVKTFILRHRLSGEGDAEADAAMRRFFAEGSGSAQEIFEHLKAGNGTISFELPESETLGGFDVSERFERMPGAEGQALWLGSGDPAPAALAEARLRSAQSMIEATDRMVSDLRSTADGGKDRDLRDAERELAKARKALAKAKAAITKSAGE